MANWNQPLDVYMRLHDSSGDDINEVSAERSRLYALPGSVVALFQLFEAARGTARSLVCSATCISSGAVAVTGDAAEFLHILPDCAARAADAGDGYDGLLLSRVACRGARDHADGTLVHYSGWLSCSGSGSKRGGQIDLRGGLSERFKENH
jgi:hypothetical protein